MEEKRLKHPLGPIADEFSEVLILGTFPSVQSREGEFYYHHPRNRFWRLLGELCREPFPETIAERRALLLRHHIALWDVVESCEIIGSSDASIRNVRPAHLKPLLEGSRIHTIFGNGSKSCELYRRYCETETGRPIVQLPSTSPANASWTYERLLEQWRQITDSIKRKS